jgi:D-alanyl-D-alanine carboxypeptidase/D-alanyl-D-alanine-endopeptidase (penicillin-binding protein 4)
VQPTPPATGGIGAVFAKHPRAWIIAASAVAFVLLGTGAVFAGAAVGATTTAEKAQGSPNTAISPSASPTPTVRPTPTALPAPTKLRTCSIAPLAASRNLGKLGASVVNATSGEVLFDRAGGSGVAPASVTKVLTAAAALSILRPDYRFSTTVYVGATPGQIVLVGGGDPTLSALPAAQQSVYANAPKLSELAAKVLSAMNDQPITSVVLDSTMWDPSAAETWDPSVPMSERTEGYLPYVTALMVDGDRANPKALTSPRSTDPVGAAGAAFVAALGLPSNIPITRAAAASTTTQLGQVQSQPLSTLIGQMMPVSDNTLAEMMARVSSVKAGNGGGMASIAPTIQKAIAAYGIDTAGLVARDGSGESNLDAIPPAMMAKFMVLVLGGTKNLKIIYDSLPVAGVSGSLAKRFTGASSIARGAITAKSGYILTAFTLAGIVRAKDGTTLTVALFAEGRLSPSAAYLALDALATGVFTCGNNVANN